MWVVNGSRKRKIKEDGRCEGKGKVAIEMETERTTMIPTERQRLIGTIDTTMKDRTLPAQSESARRSGEFSEGK
jgi:hypothetical protein